MRHGIRQNRWNLSGLLAVLLLVPAARSSILEISFLSGANVGDGGTITTDGCSICSDSDITGFDFTILGFEFTPPSSFVRVSGDPGSLLGNDFIDFLATAGTFPALSLFETGTYDYAVDLAHIEAPAVGQFSLTTATVPEPSSLALILTACLLLGFVFRFPKRQSILVNIRTINTGTVVDYLDSKAEGAILNGGSARHRAQEGGEAPWQLPRHRNDSSADHRSYWRD